MNYPVELDLHYNRSIYLTSDSLLYKITSYIFWISLILYSNPGGIIESKYVNAYYILGKINFRDVIFVILSIAYIIIPKVKNTDLEYNEIRTFLVVFLVYYFIFFVIAVPYFNGSEPYSLQSSVIKSRYALYHILLFIYVYEFFKRDSEIFYHLFLFSSIIILLVFIYGQITHSDILPVDKLNRSYSNITRLIMVSFGLMPVLIPLGVIVVIYRPKVKYKYLLLLGFSLMSICFLISLYRRYILGIFAYCILAVLLNSFITKNYYSIIVKFLKLTIVITAVIAVSYIIFPNFVKAAQKGIEETIHVIQYNKSSTGEEDVRMTFNRPFINKLFYTYPLFGTGFDYRWRGAGEEEGYEAADYPLLAALAMFGITGVLLFTPVYFVVIKTILKDIKHLRDNTPVLSMPFVLLVTFIIYFIYDILQYFNLFFPIANTADYNWFVVLAFYFSTRQLYYPSKTNQPKINS